MKEENIEKEQKPDTKWFLIITAAIVGCFVLFFVAKHILDITGHTTLDELHEMNLEGKHKGENYIYNGYSFVKVKNNMWSTQIKYGDTIFNIILRYGPKDVEDVFITGKFDQDGFNQGYAYVTFNPDDKNLKYVALAASDISTSIAKVFHVMPIAACTKNITEGCIGRPIITCEDDKPTIYLQQSEKEDDASIIFLNKCIIIKGKDLDLVKAADRFLLGWYKIMPIPRP